MRVRAAEVADDAARDALHRECFGFAPPPGMWQWKYRDNPHGLAIDHVVEEKERVVAAFALVPRRFHHAQEEVVAMQAADAMTTLKERQRGHYARLLESTEAAARARGAAVLFAFGGSQSEGSFRRAGWEVARRTQTLRVRCGGFRAQLRSRWFARDGEDFAVLPMDAIENDLPQSESMAGRRDLAWLRWRVASARYSLWRSSSGALAIIERWQDRAVLSDLLPAARWIREAPLWHGLLRTLRRTGVDTLDATLVEAEALSSMARAVGLRAQRGSPVRSLWTKDLHNLEPAPRFAALQLWLRDLDRDAEGLLMRAEAEADAACGNRT